MSLSSKSLASQSPMDFSQLLDFSKILNQSIKLVSKNGKLMALITTLSLLFPSIFFSLFTLLYHRASISNFSRIILLCAIILVEIAFLLACSVIFQLSAVATILVSAAAYRSDHDKLSLSDLFSRMKTSWRRQLSNSFSRSRNPTRFELVNGAISSVLHLACIVNITSAVSLICFLDPATAVWPLSSVVSVVEESSDGGEAEKQAERLVEGQRVQGFMLKLLFLMALVYSLILGDAEPGIQLTRGLLLLNSATVGTILWRILHVVLYFRCRKERGHEEIVDTRK